MLSPEDQLVDALREEFGEAVRGIGKFDTSHYEILYLREDLIDEYGDREYEQIWRDMILESLRKTPLEEDFVAGGEFTYSTLGFEEMTVVMVPTTEGSGLVISLDKPYFSDFNHLIDSIKELRESP